ncbi:uncharacterized protein LOC116349505 [Contarinia nasturtii]|uniref:uncharacterized protein LOC116349505 n=1 Tax=Contarinia nasturtii TaxID=265458 RepID=UPI0012D462F5|nr:uncharacterized protein LOC116349505 [Contarinia nasturtii]
MAGLESICVKISLSDCFIYIYCLYVQPSSMDKDIYEKHMLAIKSIEKIRTDKDIVLYCGDWNLPEVRWIQNDDGVSFLPIIGDSMSNKAIISRRVTTTLLEIGLSQICNFENRSSNVLDLFYTNMPELTIMNHAEILLIPDEISDKAHIQSVCTIECQPKTFIRDVQNEPQFCFKKADFDGIRDYLEQVPFDDVLNHDDINDMVKAFYDIIYEMFDQYVPRSSLRISNRPIWFNKKLSHLKNVRNREYKKLSKNRLQNPEADTQLFTKAMNEFNEYQKQRYNEYISDVARNSKNNPKLFWRHVNGRRKSNNISCKLELEDVIASTDTEKANLFICICQTW